MCSFSGGTLRRMGLLRVAMEGGGPLLLEESELSSFMLAPGRTLFMAGKGSRLYEPPILAALDQSDHQAGLLSPLRQGATIPPLAGSSPQARGGTPWLRPLSSDGSI
jgi:hypothetical protein